MTEKPQNIISEEAAEEQVKLLLSFYDIYLEDMHEDAAAGVDGAIKKIERAIRRGSVSIELDAGSLVVKQNLDHAPEGVEATLRYGEVGGRAKKAMRVCKDGDTYGRIYVLMAALCGLEESKFLSLRGKDLGIVHSLGLLFLQV